MELSRCPLCNSSELRWVKAPFTVMIKGRAKRIPHVKRQRCTACGEEFFSRESNRVLDKYRGFRKASSAVG